MQNKYIAIICLFTLLFTACSKDDAPDVLPEGSISFQYDSEKDTMEIPLSILTDSAIVIGLKAALSGSSSATEHWVSFAIDTNRINDYRAEFGDGLLMPSSSYLFFKATTRLAPGTSISEPAELNIGQQTKLFEYSTYVLPLVIQSVDGKPEGAATSRVFYLVFKTGKPASINKSGWTIADFSSQYSAFAPTNLLDENNTSTYWASNITEHMPQWVTINFNRNITFAAVNYYLPTVLGYPNNGGYATSIKIETSMDGADWVDKGTFTGNINSNMQTLEIGLTTARYLRFTALASVKYAATYDAIFVSGISLVP